MLSISAEVVSTTWKSPGFILKENILATITLPVNWLHLSRPQLPQANRRSCHPSETLQYLLHVGKRHFLLTCGTKEGLDLLTNRPMITVTASKPYNDLFKKMHLPPPIARNEKSPIKSSFPTPSMIKMLAEREGFEPSVPVLPVRSFSKGVLSASQPPLRLG